MLSISLNKVCVVGCVLLCTAFMVTPAVSDSADDDTVTPDASSSEAVTTPANAQASDDAETSTPGASASQDMTTDGATTNGAKTETSTVTSAPQDVTTDAATTAGATTDGATTDGATSDGTTDKGKSAINAPKDVPSDGAATDGTTSDGTTADGTTAGISAGQDGTTAGPGDDTTGADSTPDKDDEGTTKKDGEVTKAQGNSTPDSGKSSESTPTTTTTTTTTTTPTTEPADIGCKSSPCQNSGTCVNKDSPTEYECRCYPGWKGTNCEDDADECEDDSHSCTKEGQKCENTEGSHACSCKEGYATLDDGTCKKIILLNFYANDTLYRRIDVQKGGLVQHVPIPISYFDKGFDTIHISSQGFVTFGAQLSPEDLDKPLSKVSWPSWPPIWAIYSSKMEFDSSGGVWVYEESNRLGNVSAPSPLLDQMKEIVNVDNFQPLWGLVVTWSNAKPSGFPEDHASFQLVLATDGKFTYAANIYDDIWKNTQFADNPSISYGYTDADLTFKALDDPEFTSKKGIALFEGSASDENKQCVRALQYVPETMGSNLGSLPVCPCLEITVKLDRAFKLKGPENTQAATCYNSRFSKNGLKQTCCFSTSGILTTNEAAAKYPTGDDKLETAFQECCETESTLCGRFYTSFPSSNCSVYQPPKIVTGFGDFHLTTLKGNHYTINGKGEYVVFQFDLPSNRTVILQGRMETTEGFNSTRFTAYALQIGKDLSAYEMYIDSANTTLSGTWKESKPDLDNVAEIDESEDNTIAVDFMSEISIIISESENYLKHEVILPLKFQAPNKNGFQSKGLLGVDQEDADFVLSNGTSMSADVSSLSPEDVNAFLESWRVSKDNSLFSYTYPTVKTYEEINDDSYTAPLIPTTVEGVKTGLENKGIKEKALEICGDTLFCLQDYFVNENNASADDVIKETNAIKSQKDSLDARLVEVKLPNKLMVSKDSALNFSLALGGGGEATYTVEAADLTTFEPKIEDGNNFLWNISNSIEELRELDYPISLKIIAAPDKGEATPSVTVCLCEEASQCDENLPPVTTPGSTGNVQLASCRCNDASKSGQFCNEDVDLCENCYDKSKCNTTLEDYCGACPEGFEGNGRDCRDTNECLIANGGCNQKCENNDGGFKCTCEDGFTLEGNTTCEDTDECSLRPLKCEHGYCVNEVGRYHCQCYPGFDDYEHHQCSLLVESTFIGKITLTEMKGQQEWSEQLQDPSSEEFKELAGKVESAIKKHIGKQSYEYLVQVVSFQAIEQSESENNDDSSSSGALRRKRDAESPHAILATFALHTNDTDLMAETIPISRTSKCEGNCFYQELVVVDSPKMEKEENEDLCAYPLLNKCNSVTTSCQMKEEDKYHTFECLCKDGLEINPLDPYSCEDEDECLNPPANCSGCTNTFRSFSCKCDNGHYWDDLEHTCKLGKCENNPCQHDGECIVVSEEPGYACKCTAEYTGTNCDDEDDDYHRLEVAVICVSVILGVLSLFLFIFLLTVCIKHRKTLESHVYESSQANEYSGIPRPRVKDAGSRREMSENGSSYYDTLETGTVDRPRYENTQGDSRGSQGKYVYKNEAFEGERL